MYTYKPSNGKWQMMMWDFVSLMGYMLLNMLITLVGGMLGALYSVPSLAPEAEGG